MNINFKVCTKIIDQLIKVCVKQSPLYYYALCLCIQRNLAAEK